MRLPIMSFLILFSSTAFPMGQGKDECTTKVTRRVESPDKRNSALVQEVLCSGDYVTTFVDEVRINSSARNGDEVVFAMDAYTESDKWPELVWMSNQELKITIPERYRTTVGMSKSKALGIRTGSFM